MTSSRRGTRVLVVAETADGRMHRASREALTAAHAIGDAVFVVLPGDEGTAAALELASYEVSEVVRLEHEALAVYTADAFIEALAAFIRATEPSVVLFPHTYRTRDFAPALAARLNRSIVSDCIAARWDDTLVLTRPIFQGKVHADVVTDDPMPWFVSCQAGAFSAAEPRGDAAAPIRLVAATVTPSKVRQRPEPPVREEVATVNLVDAARIVSVGRGIKDQDRLGLVRELASALGAELAASRPICDAGWLPMERQVGSSGQTVAPELYLAIGISGAIQHIVGMKGAQTIAAINTDAGAPIFEVADYGIVGDLFEVVPAMIEALREKR